MLQRLVVALVLLALALVGWRSIVIVEQGELAVASPPSGAQSQVFSPGLHWMAPWSRLQRLDARLLTAAFPGENFVTADKIAVEVDFYVKWRLIDAVRFLRNGGDEDQVATRLRDAARAQLGRAIASMPLAALVAESGTTLSNRLRQPLQAVATDAGVELADVQLQRIDLKDPAGAGILARMQQALLNSAAATRDDGVQQAAKLRAEADSKRLEEQAAGARAAQRLRGDADARATTTYAAAYRRNPNSPRFIATSRRVAIRSGGRATFWS